MAIDEPWLPGRPHSLLPGAPLRWTAIFGLPALAAAAVALAVCCLVPRAPADPDIWWHLRNAATEAHMRGWLHSDLYSFTAAGAPWIDHEWLAELPFFLGWRLAGAHGLYLTTLPTVECIFLGLFWLAYRKSGSALAAMLATSLAAVLATVSFAPRPLLFGWLCLIVELLLLERSRRGENAIFALPLLFVLWVNLHGSWLIGLVLFAVFLACGARGFRRGSLAAHAWNHRQRRKLALAFALSVGALFVNPYGWRLAAYPFDLAFRQKLNIASVEEWRPLDLQSARGHVLLGMLGVLFVAQLVRRRNWTLTEAAFAAIGIYAGCRHARFLFLTGILLAPPLAAQLALFDRGGRRVERGAERTGPNAALLLAMLLLMAAFIAGGWPRPTPIPEEKFPERALPFLQGLRAKGPVFNEYLWGGYLDYCVPALPVFIDSRVDIFERNGTLRDYLDIIHLKDPLALLDRYGIRYVLFEKDAPLVYLLAHTRAWKTDYDDGHTIVLERVAAAR